MTCYLTCLVGLLSLVLLNELEVEEDEALSEDMGIPGDIDIDWSKWSSLAWGLDVLGCCCC